jgi:predicted N-acetyltransferase YhbS
MEEKYLLPALDLVKSVFAASESAESADFVVRLIKEIRSKRYYIPELELVMVDENDEVIGYAMFSRWHLGGEHENELLILTPVAVKTELQRQHISKDLIEYGFKKARDMGFKAVQVEGNPKNYESRGFRPSYEFEIVAGPKIKLPRPECLMYRELIPGALDEISGVVDYSFYDTLMEEES